MSRQTYSKQPEHKTDSIKEEGEISDDEDHSTGPPRKNSARNETNSRPQLSQHANPVINREPNKGVYSPFLGSKNRTRHLVGHARFVRNDGTGVQQPLLPNPRKILPSLMDVRTTPSKFFNRDTHFPKSQQHHVNPSTHNYSIQQPNPYVESPSSRLWNKRRLRNSKEDSKPEKKDDDYLNMLTAYKGIKEKLDQIRKQEEKGSAEVTEKTAKPKQPQLGSISGSASTTSLPPEDKSSLNQNAPSKAEGSTGDTDLEDEDLDELELRRIALASAAAKMMSTEAEEDIYIESFSDLEKADVGCDQDGQSFVHPSDRQRRVHSNNEKKGPTASPRGNRPRSNKGHPLKPYNRQLRSRTPALTARKAFQKRTMPNYHRPEHSRKLSDSKTRQTTYSKGVNRSRSSADGNLGDGHRRSRSKELTSPRRGTEISSEYQTREIQKILTLDDPEEQVSRFLSLMDRKSGTPALKSSFINQSQPSSEIQTSEQDKDNYDEVEMDIDSDPDTPAVMTSTEDLQLESDYSFAMQPMYEVPNMPVLLEQWPQMYPSTDFYPSSNMVSQHAPLMPVTDPLMNNLYTNINTNVQPAEFVNAIHPPPPPPPPPPKDPPPQPPLPPSDPPLPADQPPPPPPPPLPIDSPPLPPQHPHPTDIGDGGVNTCEQLGNSRSEYMAGYQNVYLQPAMSMPAVTRPSDYQQDIYPQYEHSQIQTHGGYPSDTVSEMQSFPSQWPAGNSEQLHTGEELWTTDHMNLYRSSVNNTNNSYVRQIPNNFGSSGDFEAPYPSEGEDSDVKLKMKSTEISRKELQREMIIDGCSDTKAIDLDESEEEETLLRAQLLQSLAKKQNERLEILKKKEKSLSLSPSRSPGGHVRPATKPTTKGLKSRVHMGNLPVHKPVVIQLGDDTSEEEEDASPQKEPFMGMERLLGGIDSFLKEARRTSELQNQERSDIEEERKKRTELLRKQELEKFIHNQEELVLKQTSNITKDQGVLKNLLEKATKYHKNVRVCDRKVKQLREQLNAAEKIYAVNRELFVKTKEQAGLVKDRLLKKKETCKGMQESLLKRKLQLLEEFPDLVPVLQASPVPPPTRTVQSTNIPLTALKAKNQTAFQRNKHPRTIKNMTITINNSKSTVTKTDDPEVKNKTGAKTGLTQYNIAKEKARLQKLAVEYETKIKQLRKQELDHKENVKLNSGSIKSDIVDVTKPHETEMIKQVLKLEKIELGPDTIDLTEEPDTQKRRRSLMEMNPSTRPDLKLKLEVNRSASQEEKESHINVNVPNGKELLKLVRLQKARVDEDLKTLSLMRHDAIQAYHALVPRKEPVSFVQVYRGKIASQGALAGHKASKLAYRSPLLHFRAYRFSPYFRTKSFKQLTSNSLAHKILPKKIFCRFDVNGTCNDEKCRGQHEADYRMSDKEVLCDIISYCPSLAGVQPGMTSKKIAKMLGDYLDNFIKHNQGRLTQDQLCLLLISRVNAHAKHVPPHTMFYHSRFLKPKQEEVTNDEGDRNQTLKPSEDNFSFQVLETSKMTSMEESRLCEDERRYFFTNDGVEIQDLESSVLSSPHDVQLWMKLSSKKLNNQNNSPQTCLDEALNVLARGLENNKDNSELWYEYLCLFSKHRDASDFSDLCQTALQYAPSFLIWWKYLHSLVTYIDRNEVCTEIVEYLCTQQSKCELNPSISHHLLETMLYKALLNVQAGELQYAKNILEGYFVKSEGRPSSQSWLTVEDKSVLWLSYIHLLSWNKLPQQLWNPIKNNGKIVCKGHLYLPWHELPTTEVTFDVQMGLIQEAINVCINNRNQSGQAVLKEGLILYKNLIHLLQSQNKLEEMLTVCRDLLQKDPSLYDIWLIVANLYAGNKEVEATKQVFGDATEVTLLAAKVFHYAAKFEMANKDFTCAISHLEKCPFGYFDFDVDTVVDPASLYCTLLKQALPLGYTSPSYKSEYTEDLFVKQQTYLWLNYCLLLELKKDMATAVEMYETAISSLIRVKDVSKVWAGYIAFQYRQVCDKPDNMIGCRRLSYLLHRCLTTIPVRLELPFWHGEYMMDYTHVNLVLDCYLNLLLPEQQVEVLERVVPRMPLNTGMVLRLCAEYLRQGDHQRVSSLCYPLVYDSTTCSQVWKLVISTSIKQGNHHQTEKMFRKAVHTVPYSLSMWKDFLMYELTRGEQAKQSIAAIISHCQMLGLNTAKLVSLLQIS